MKYTKASFSIELIGTRYGYQWNDRMGWAHVSTVLTDYDVLPSQIRNICSPDFQQGKLTPDTVIKVTLIKANRRTVRYFDITLFKSVSKYIGELESIELGDY